MKKSSNEKENVDVMEVHKGIIEVCIVGDRPAQTEAYDTLGTGFICNRLSEKTKHELLMPAPKRNRVERQTLLKHKPYDEFAASPYTLPDGAPTLIATLSAAFKRSMMTAALDLPGTKKAQIGRLCWVHGKYTPLFGIPEIMCSPVRSADMARTPDIRTRAVLPRWACRVKIGFSQPLIKVNAVLRLLAAAGMYIGVGDWRNEKGSGTYGSFHLVEPDDAEYLDLVKTGGRAAQIEGMKAPQPYDAETSELLAWFDDELARRQGKGVA